MPNADVKEQDTIAKAAQRNFSVKRVLHLLRRGARSVYKEGFEATWRKIAFRIALMRKGEVWMYKSDICTKKELKQERRTKFEKRPFFSIIVPVYNTPERFLREMIDSCLRQTYEDFELCLADASTNEVPAKIIQSYVDKRIKYKKLSENKGIAENTNEAFEMAEHKELQYFILLDHDDLLRPNALFEVTNAILLQDADFVYSDEIVLSEDLKHLKSFHFKPGFSPDTLRGCNYITHLSAFQRELAEKAGLYERAEYDGAQDFDLILRLTEQAKQIVHIPKVLYTWRAHSASTAGTAEAKPYAVEAGRKAVQSHLDRTGLKGTVEALACAGSYRVRYELINSPLVSVVIPNKDHVTDLTKCINALFHNNKNMQFEVIIVENNSTQQETFDYYEALVNQYKNCKIVYYAEEFNFSAICNLGVQHSTGQHILLLNNDVEMTSENFLEELLMFSQRQDVGAVGAKLIYPDEKIQHAGIFIGLGGSAGHSHKGHPASSGGDMYRLATAQNMSAVTGACLMVKKELYNAIGGLDAEQFAIAFNDVDFCLRLREKGFLNVFTPFAEGIHYESLTRGYEQGSAQEVRFEKEKATFQEKYKTIFEKGDPYYNPHLTLEFENYAIG